MKRKLFLNFLGNKWKEDKGYCSKFDRRLLYKDSTNKFVNKMNNSFNERTYSTELSKSRPKTSLNRTKRRSNMARSSISGGFNILRRKRNSENPSFLEIKSKEIQKPIHLNNYENMYAGELKILVL